jgi:hypothetical protein
MQMDYETIKVILAVLGAITGTVALVWRIIDEFGSFLRISLKVEPPKDGWTTALTAIENKGNRPKRISYATLLIGPESESPIETARILAREASYSKPLNHTNDFEFFVVSKPVVSGDRMLIPLPFYYSENVDFVDETVTYRVPVSIETFAPATPYAVRFYVFAAPRLLRSTQDTFIGCEKPATRQDG